MGKSTRSNDGLNYGVVIYDEVEQNLRERLGSDAEARREFYSPIINGAGDGIQLIGGIDWSSGKDWSVIVRNPRLLTEEKRENEKRELFVNYLRTIYGHVLVFNMIYLYCEKWRKTQLTMLFLNF